MTYKLTLHVNIYPGGIAADQIPDGAIGADKFIIGSIREVTADDVEYGHCSIAANGVVSTAEIFAHWVQLGAELIDVVRPGAKGEALRKAFEQVLRVLDTELKDEAVSDIVGEDSDKAR